MNSRVLFLLLAALAAHLPHANAQGSVQVTVKDNKGQSVADAVVSLLPLDAKPLLAAPAEPVVISQRNQEFEPLVTAVIVGTRISFPNRDAIRHQVYSLSKTKRFEIPLYGPGAGETLLFDRAGTVALGCNIHEWMTAYIVVLETPFFMKTPATGLAALTAIPPGRYRLDVWHPRLVHEATREVVISPSDVAAQTIAITLRPNTGKRRAPDGLGGGYK
jgi:plastocyanin